MLAYVGSEVTLSCSFSKPIWIKSEVNNHLSLEARFHQEGSNLIFRVKSQDSGVYVCQGLEGNSLKEEKTILYVGGVLHLS